MIVGVLGREGFESVVSSKELSLHDGGRIFLLLSLSKISFDSTLDLHL